MNHSRMKPDSVMDVLVCVCVSEAERVSAIGLCVDTALCVWSLQNKSSTCCRRGCVNEWQINDMTNVQQMPCFPTNSPKKSSLDLILDLMNDGEDADKFVWK